MHGLFGYREVIDTIKWGLNELGHPVTETLNTIEPDKVNVLFGGQMLELEQIVNLPENTIFYHLEQLSGLEKKNVRMSVKVLSKKFQLWDYSRANLTKWQELGTLYPVKHVPIGYAEPLTHIEKVEEDIDVLFYGVPGQNRLHAIVEACNRRLKVVYACGLYGASRDSLIARSKIVLNINIYDSKIFEEVRVSYLLANRKAVVADADPDTRIEDDMRFAVRFAPLNEIAKTCKELVADDDARHSLEEAGFEAIKNRDIRKILAEVLP